MIQELETERLILRKGRLTVPTPEELEADYLRYRIEHEDPECTFELYRDVAMLSYFSAKEGGPFGHYVLYPKNSKEWIGHCPLLPRLCTPAELGRFSPSTQSTPPENSSLEVEIGWALSLYYRGQGYATEAAHTLLQFAFQTLGVRRVIAFTEKENLASINVMGRLKMRMDVRADSSTVIGCIEQDTWNANV